MNLSWRYLLATFVLLVLARIAFEVPGLVLALALSATAVLFLLRCLLETDMSYLKRFTNYDAFVEDRRRQSQRLRAIDPQTLRDKLAERIIGQDRLLAQIAAPIAKRFRRPRPHKPIFSLLLAGPTGTGKTELAKALTEALYGDEAQLFRIDCGGIPGHGISSIVGSPRGIVGSDSWGPLPAHLRDTPETVVLFDELEKAGGEREFQNMMYTLLDEGYVTEVSDQTKVDAGKAIIIATSNACAEELAAIAKRFANDAEALDRQVKQVLKNRFDSAFLNRFDLIATADALGDEAVGDICLLHILKLVKDHELVIPETPEAIDHRLISALVDYFRQHEADGMRPLIKQIERLLADPLFDAQEQDGLQVMIHYEEDRPRVEIVEWRTLPGDEAPNPA